MKKKNRLNEYPRSKSREKGFRAQMNPSRGNFRGKLIEMKGNSQLDCFQLAPDEERDSPDIEGTSRRLERQKSSGERGNYAEKRRKALTRLEEAAACRRHRGRLQTTSRDLRSKED